MGSGLPNFSPRMSESEASFLLDLVFVELLVTAIPGQVRVLRDWLSSGLTALNVSGVFKLM